MASMTNPGASSSSSSTHSYAYDVFLSYNSEDTSAFTCHLHSALCGMGINTYLHEELVREEEISAIFLQVFELSKISLIVFSETLASSTWLDQLGEIIQCRKSKQQLVLPIFYKVDPTNLRDHSALSNIANLSRWCFLDGYASQFIHMLVTDISSTLCNGTSLDMAMYKVGMGPRRRDMCNLLNIGENSVQVVGIWGIGGIGKTTIAKSVYSSIAHRFEGTCFLANLREKSMLDEGLVQLQETLLTDILEDKSLRVTNVEEGMQLIEEKLSQKRVLLVLDDVNQLNQLDKLAQRSTWFGSGSRIIITTRDRHLLNAHQVETIYKVKELNHDEALELFSWHAFRGQPFGDYAEMAVNAIEYAYGLPLLLTVLGSHLRGRSIDEWKETLHSKRAHYIEFEYVLRRSYDALDDTVKIAFLDIACFFKGKKMKYVQQILEDSGLDSRIAIQTLAEKALITIQNQPLVGKIISMHDLIEEMGRDIVHQESPNEPGERSRLWWHEDVDYVQTFNTGTDKIRGIKVNCARPNKGFSNNMKNLKCFISGDVCLSGDILRFGLSRTSSRLCHHTVD
ncbi:disease resistance protein RUN1-like [Rosa chinensis]|uniref:disease resistance protein RUN1-like n=1 Tax=Rosa chinensis TaxID=74649 RepID=UPI000D08EBDD|nr:disease resistance protein RUN1-like [Rosa chinensis]